MKNILLFRKPSALLFWSFALLFSMSGYSQISIASATPVTENFTIGTSTTASLPTNWKMSAAGAGSSTLAYTAAGNVTAVTQGASSGAPSAGGRYNWGNGTTTTDRAIGFLTSGSYASPNAIQAFYRNTSASQISDLTISFDFERYKINSAAASVTFFTSTNGTSWTARTEGDIAAGVFATGTSAYNFTTGTTVNRSVTLTGVNIPVSGDFYVMWIVNTTGGNSQGIGLDNVSLTATFAAACTPQTITALSTPVTKALGETHSVFTTADSGLAVTYASSNPSVATVASNGDVNLVSAGNTIITASQAGGLNNSITYCAATSVSQSLTVTAVTPNIIISDQIKNYGDDSFSMAASSNSPGVSNYISFDTNVAIIDSTTGFVTIKGVGTTTILFSQAASGIYAAGSLTATLTVNPATTGITITANGVSKTYGDVLNNGSSTDFTVSGLLYSDNLGTGATVTNTYGLGGAATASVTLAAVSPAVYVGTVVPSALVVGTGSNLYNPANYAVAPTFVSGDITVSKANQAITFANSDTKEYGTTDYATGANSTTSVVNPITYSSDNTTVADIVSGNIHIVGVGSATLTASQVGNDNYNAATSVNQSLTVTPKGLTISGLSANNKNFDGNTDVTLSGTGSLNGIVGSDDVVLSGTPVGTFASSAVGTNIVVSVTGYTLAGANASNYSIPQPVNVVLSADIIANSPTIFTNGTLTSVNTTYGSASATPTSFNVTAQSLTDVITIAAPTGFEVSTSSTTGYASTITVGGSGNLSSTPIFVRLAATTAFGTYSGNITLDSPSAAQVTIATITSSVAPKILTISGLTGVDKTYDITTTATVTGTATLNGVVGTDDVTLDSTLVTYSFATADAGTDKPITAAGFELSGTTATNYTVSQPTGITATINKAASSISVTGSTTFTFNNSSQGPNTSNVTGSTGAVTYNFTGVSPVVATSPTQPTNAGTYTVAATVAADSNYEAATSADFSFTIGKADQTITLAATDAKTTASAAYTLPLNADSGLPITYTSPDTSVITISGNTVTIVGAGTATITANQAGNDNYNAATQASQVLTVTVVASNIFSNPITGTNPNTSNPYTIGQIINSNITVSGIGRGTGITGANANDRYAASGWNSTSLDTNDYFEFTLTPNSGFTISFENFIYTGQASGTGATSVALRSSLDSFGSNIGSATIIGSTISLSGVSYQNITTAITFRLYGWGASAAGGTFSVNSFQFNGFVNQLPAPAITSVLTASGTVGTSFSYTTTATNNPSSYAATGLPSGLTINTTTGVISGTPLVAGTFNVSLTASNGSTSPVATLVLTIAKGSQVITFSSVAPSTFGAAPFDLNGSVSSALPVSYVSSNESVATISGNTVTIVGAGSTTITASQAGDDNYFSATSVNQELVVNKANQSITFGALPAKNDVDASFTLGATASSGLAVSYSSSNTAVVTISGNTVTIVAPGTSIITASQTGNANYNPATSVDQEQTIVNTQLANQTITFGALSAVTYGDAPFILNATVNSPLTITYTSSDDTIASVIGNTVTIHKPGTVLITASQDGDSTHNPAADVSQSLIVNKKGLNAVNVSISNKTYDGTTAATLTADLDGLIGTDEVILTNAAVFATADAGTGIEVTANLSISGAQADRYEIIQPTGLTSDILLADQTITFEAIADKSFGNAAFNLVASGGSSGSPVIFTSSDPLVAAVLGNTVTIVGVGPVTITASQAGNSNYNAAIDVAQSFTVSKANQTITFNALVNRTTADNTFTLNATATSTLLVSYTSSNESVATIIGNVVTILGPGTTTISASQAGNDLYNPATSVDRTQMVLTAIAKWTFEGVTIASPGTTAVVSAGSAVADQGLQTSGSLFSGVHTSASTAWSTPAGNGSVKSLTSANWGIGDYYQFQVNTSNYQNLSIAFDQTGSNTGPSTFKVQYSLDGTNFTDIGSTYILTNDGWSSTVYKSASNRSFDLSTLISLNNKTSVYFRIVSTSTNAISGSLGTAGTNRLDNFVVTGIGCDTTSTSETVTACDSYTWSENNINYTETGVYVLEFTTPLGCTYTKTLNLTINNNTIASQPSGATICKAIGASASMSVVSDSSTATYQWYSQLATANPTTGVWTLLSNGANYSGVTEATLNITRTTVAVPATGTKYRVVVNSGCGSGITSAFASITDQAISPKATAITAKSSTNAALSPALTACEGSTLNLSLATGSIGNIQWMYSSDSGSTWSSFASYTQTALSATNGILNEVSPALLPGSAWFKVVVTNGVCDSIDSAILKLTVSAQPVAGTISGGDVTVCVPLATGFDASGAALTSPITNSTTLTLSGSSNVGTIVWEKSINYTAATPTWAAVTNLTATTAIGASASGAGTPALTVGNLAVSTWYRAKVTNGACVDYTPVVKITVSPAAKAGVITAPLTACSTGDISFTSAAYVGSSIAWQVSTTSATTGYTTVAGETGLVFTMTNVPYAPLSKFYVRSVVTSGDCTSSFSAAKTVTVDPLSVGGTVTGGGTVCSLGGGTLSLSGNVGKIQWQYSTDGGATYVNAPSATVGSSSSFTTTSATSIAATYVVANVSSNTLFRALVTSGVCSSSASNAVEFVIGTEAVAGTISAQASTVCAASGTTLTLSGNLGSIVWQKSTNWTAATPTWTAVTTSVTPTLSTGALAATTAFRAKVTIGLCSTVYTDVTVITVSPTAKGGVVAVNVAGTDVCSGSSKAMKVTGNVGTIQWQMSTTSATAGFVDVAGATTTPYTFTNITQPTWFRVVATSGVCTTTSASNAIGITVSTTPAVAGTISGVNSVCTATGSTLSLAGSTGTIVWQKSASPFTTWTAIAGATTTSLATGNLTATTAYRAILTSGTCTAVTDAYTVTVSPAAKATAISGNALIKTLANAICTSATAPLTLATGSIGTIEWQYYYAGSSATSVTNTSVVTWTPIVGATSTVYNASSDQAGNVWFRAVFTSGPCQTKAYSVPVNVWFKSCEVVKVDSSTIAFGVKVYPNPSSENFNFSLTTSSQEKVGVVVYDMTGKMIDQREVSPSQVSDLQIGDRYPSGVYNVIVTQGSEVKTLRVVKR